MDSIPPYHRSEPRSGTKSASRFAIKKEEIPNLSIDLIQSSPNGAPSPSTLSLRSSGSVPIRELLLLSHSPIRRSKSRLTDRLHMAEEHAESAGPRRRCKSRAAQTGVLGCASPKNVRRSRRRSELEIREEKDLGLAEEAVKPRKKRISGRSKKENLSLVPSISVPCSSPSPKIDEEEDTGSLDQVGQLMTDLIMWKDIARSSLWFGFGSLFFLSSCYSSGISFSIFSAISQLGLLVLGASFFSNSVYHRNDIEKKSEIMLKENDILRVAKIILPATNFVISKTRELFSGEPSMTLKVAPFLLLGAEYGHLITPWRLCAFGFFMAFTMPRLYSCYSSQIGQRVEYLKWWVLEAWDSCSHKKIVAASAVTAFWNLSTIKTRIFTAFISLVIVRYCRQHMVQNSEDKVVVKEEDEPQQQALVVADMISKQ